MSNEVERNEVVNSREVIEQEIQRLTNELCKLIPQREEVLDKEIQRLTNQLWKLIPMRENEEDWQKQLDTVTLEIAGLSELFDAPQFLQLLSKLKGLRTYEVSFEVYRKTVFESIALLRGLNVDPGAGYNLTEKVPYRLMKGRIGTYDKRPFTTKGLDPALKGIPHQAARFRQMAVIYNKKE